MELLEYITKALFWTVMIGAGGYGVRVGTAQMMQSRRRAGRRT
jgi:hypothetical protein